MSGGLRQMFFSKFKLQALQVIRFLSAGETKIKINKINEKSIQSFIGNPADSFLPNKKLFEVLYFPWFVVASNTRTTNFIGWRKKKKLNKIKKNLDDISQLQNWKKDQQIQGNSHLKDLKCTRKSA